MEDSTRQSQLIMTKKAPGQSETYSEPSQTSKTEFFSKTVKIMQSLTIFAKCSILGSSKGYDYASDNAR